jgi:DNA-binding SARP family transcriptional activator
MALVRLEVLGGAQLTVGEQRMHLERKVAAALSYLAVEGRTPKPLLMALLWPEANSVTAGNNFRQMLRRLRQATGEELVLGRGHAELVAHVACDLADLKGNATGGHHAKVLSHEGVPLAGLDYSDCPEFEAWLGHVHQRVAGYRAKARQQELIRLENAKELTAALALAEDWASEDATNEEAARARMRLHFLLGHRSAALVVHERLKSALARELGVTPMLETRQLVRDIERGRQPPAASETVSREGPLPARILRPPVLAGREAVWRQLEEGWASGQFLCIAGDPGTGKSRLATDFAESKGRWICLEGRAGDREVPYSSHTRALRYQLTLRPDVTFPDWVRIETGRLLPELLLEGEHPPPFIDEAGRLRFFESQVEAMKRTLEGYDTVVTDDMQYWDQASAEVFLYVFSRTFERSFLESSSRRPLPRFVDCYRKDELPPYLQQLVHHMQETRLARHLTLEPLSVEAVRTLVTGLDLPGMNAHADRLARYTGGNPLFIVETVKHLVETGGWERGWPERFPPPGQVGPLIQRRLERLSPMALRAARVVALASAHATVDLLSTVLGADTLAVAEALADLEAAQILRGVRFTHDLIEEAVLESLPASIRQTLHARLAEALSQEQVPAGTLAHHWLEAGKSQRAVPYLLQAAEQDEAALLFAAAATHYGRAADVLEMHHHSSEASRLRQRAATCMARRALG